MSQRVKSVSQLSRFESRRIGESIDGVGQSDRPVIVQEALFSDDPHVDLTRNTRLKLDLCCIDSLFTHIEAETLGSQVHEGERLR